MSLTSKKVADQPLDFVYFSNADWDYNRQRPQQFASRLSRHGKVLFVSPFGIRSITSKDLPRIVRRIHSRFIQRRNPGLDEKITIHEPFFYLPFPNHQFASNVNGYLLRISLQKWMKKNFIHDALIWAGVPSTAVVSAVKLMSPSFLIYDCIDNFAAMHKKQAEIIKAEEFLAARAQVVFASSEELYEKMKQINDQTFLLPNAADFHLFRQAVDSSFDTPPDIAKIQSPILGYVGEIAKWFDFDLIHDVAVQNPDWNVVMLGRISDNSAKKILALPNVYFLGRKDHDQLPAYFRKFDVGLLPFQVNRITSAVSPVKLFEYLAAGKPVVSTPLKEVMRYDDVVEIADRAEFNHAIKTALAGCKDKENLNRRLKVAMNNTWDQRVEEVIKIVRETFRRLSAERSESQTQI